MKCFGLVIACLLVASSLLCGKAQAMSAIGDAPFINTWLVAGPFPNDNADAGFAHDFIGEVNARPTEGATAGDRKWSYFDDRLFSRNYDDYQDLYSYYTVKKGFAPEGRVVYAHVYIYAPDAHAAQLRVGADCEFRAWVNGATVGDGSSPSAGKDATVLPITIKRGWNGVLLKVASRADGFLGFYARITDPDGNTIRGLVSSVDGGDGVLAIATRSLRDVATAEMPAGYRGWPYVEFRVPYIDYWKARYPSKANRADCFAQASSFQLMASGGVPPYRWSADRNALPAGLTLAPEGTIHGRIASRARLGKYDIAFTLTDSTGKSAHKTLSLEVNERPNRWYEQAGLVGLVHAPETLQPRDFDGFAELMKRQGYQVAELISYGNGDYRFRYPSRFEPHNSDGDLIGSYKAALDKAGVKTGMYFGNIANCPQFSYSQTNSVYADAIGKYHPAVVYLDWATFHVTSDDAIYSAIRSADPNAVIVLNGMERPENGDWDVLCIESMAYGRRALIWDSWPNEYCVSEMPMVPAWPKGQSLESWRVIVPAAQAVAGADGLDWQDMLRLQISLIGDGCTANIDHTPMYRIAGKPLPSTDQTILGSPVLAAHGKMAEWANPAGAPALYTSYTNVDKGPLPPPSWGYDTLSRDRMALYLHFIKNPRGKTGLPGGGTVSIGSVGAKVRSATWMNVNRTIPFAEHGQVVELDTHSMKQDPVDTIVRLDLATALPLPDTETPYPAPAAPQAAKANVAFHKPAKLLSLDGQRSLPPCGGVDVASNAVDDDILTVAQASDEYAWTLQVDLKEVLSISKINVTFTGNYATEYSVDVSADSVAWTTIKHSTSGDGAALALSFAPTKARYVRIRGIKPDGPNQPGGQMAISEVQVFQ